MNGVWTAGLHSTSVMSVRGSGRLGDGGGGGMEATSYFDYTIVCMKCGLLRLFYLGYTILMCMKCVWTGGLLRLFLPWLHNNHVHEMCMD